MSETTNGDMLLSTEQVSRFMVDTLKATPSGEMDEDDMQRGVDRLAEWAYIHTMMNGWLAGQFDMHYDAEADEFMFRASDALMESPAAQKYMAEEGLTWNDPATNGG